jgi:hypothetical protein
MAKAKKPVAKYGHPSPQKRNPLRINTFYAHDRLTRTDSVIEARIIKVVLGDGFGGGFELEISVDTGSDPTKPELVIRSNDGRLVIKPEVTNKITVRAEES